MRATAVPVWLVARACVGQCLYAVGRLRLPSLSGLRGLPLNALLVCPAAHMGPCRWWSLMKSYLGCGQGGGVSYSACIITRADLCGSSGPLCLQACADRPHMTAVRRIAGCCGIASLLLL